MNRIASSRNICLLASSCLTGWLICNGTSACPPETIDPQAQTSTPLVALGEVSTPQARVIDLAICLDTSGSMEKLIDAARIKLWDIVNDLALAKPTPALRVALLTYGNNGHVEENGWVNIDTPFTDDLDLVSKKLFAMTTNGGTELVGRVVHAAAEQLQWSDSADALKIIIVAGNESADQDQQMPFRDVCRSTIAKGIMVNSIYCGNAADGIAPGWKEVATLADGHFAAIDHENGTIVISTPFDDELATLSASLNTTYIPFGAEGREFAQNQVLQDANAEKLGAAVAAQRCVTKSGVMYRNGQWDLVDACKEATFKLDDVKNEELPEAMKTMTIEQRRDYVKQMDTKRAEIQTKVSDLTTKRQQFVEAEMKKAAETGDKSFDAAIRNAVRQQAASKGFVFETTTAASAPKP